MKGLICGASLALSLGGCSLVVDADREQCVRDDDCARLGLEAQGSVCIDSLCAPAPDPDWACLDEPVIQPLNPPRQIKVTAQLINVLFNMPQPGVEVFVCERLDTECHIPIASGISDTAGEVVLTLAGGFNGYLLWRAPDTQPVLYFFGGPLFRDSVVLLQVIPQQIMDSLAAQFEGQTVENRAVVAAFTSNCNGVPAGGVRVSALEGDSATRTLYLADGLFPPSQAETTTSGVARIINVPTGNVSITATLNNDREIATNRVLTRTGFATITVLAPRAPF